MPPRDTPAAPAEPEAAEPEAPAEPAAGTQIRVTALVNVDTLRAGETRIVDDTPEWRARVENGLAVLS